MSAKQANRPVAIFDLDRTVTTIGTFTPFCVYAAWRLNPLRLLTAPVVILALAATGLGLTTRKTLKTLLLALLVGRRSRAKLDPVVSDFAALFLRKYLRQGALDTLSRVRNANAILYLATASYDFYAERFAEALAFDGLIATRSIWNDDHLVPGIDGENCYGTEKLRRVHEQLQADGIAVEPPRPHIVFYSDDRSDLPCLLWADEGIAVNPKPKFVGTAEAHGLEIVRW